MYYCFSALFLSALKSQGVPYSPAGIKRAIEGSATPLGSHLPFSIGRGVIQVQYTLYKLCSWTRITAAIMLYSINITTFSTSID